MGNEIRAIAVIGAGIMGHGIAQEFAVAGYRVALTDASGPALEKAQATIAANLEGASEAPEVLGRLSFSASLAEVVRDADYVVEAVTERLPLKQEIFAELDRLAPPHAILASNTSSFMPSQIAPSTTRPENVLVTHYFNPPHVVPLVEVVRGPQTAPETVETVVDLYRTVGKIPVVVNKERLGFIGNRLQNALFREALALVDEGVCSIEDVDTVMHTSIGRRWSVAGIYEVFDLAGLDTVFAVASEVFPDLSNASEPPAWFRRMIERGQYGIKSGRGFYDWPEERGVEARRRIRTALKLTGTDIETKQHGN